VVAVHLSSGDDDQEKGEGVSGCCGPVRAGGGEGRKESAWTRGGRFGPDALLLDFSFLFAGLKNFKQTKVLKQAGLKGFC
jgi:hypothetical protein